MLSLGAHGLPDWEPEPSSSPAAALRVVIVSRLADTARTAPFLHAGHQPGCQPPRPAPALCMSARACLWTGCARKQRCSDCSRWARKQKLTRLDFAAVKWTGPSGVMDTETRWGQARWLLHDDTLKPEDHVAGLLVLLYAQWPAWRRRFSH
jgi:hypothetical protein